MSKDSDSFSFVVLGAMNPRIHHPTWYQLTEIFTAPETDAAIESQAVVCTPAFSQFKVAGLTIKCLLERWDITTSNSEEIDRIREIGERVFDKHLQYTPLSVLALNFDYVRQFPGRKVRDFVAGIVSGVAARMVMPTADGGEVIFKRKLDTIPEIQGLSTIAIRSTDDADCISLCCNYQYTLGFDGQFDMAGFLPDCASKAQADAESSLNRLFSVIESGSKE
jgi:hypothetical protein